MTHRFPIKEIARQSGLGPATIDRVLNDRPNVSPQTRARVLAAIEELEAQETLLAARGRRLFFDFVLEAPARFSREVKRAAELAAVQTNAAVCRARFVMHDEMSDAEVVAALRRIQKRGSHGICLKARDTAVIRNEVNALQSSGIPVVTLVTDIPDCARVAYVGLDNAGAGRAAAYMVSTTLGAASGTVLTSRSSELFLGEQARQDAFVARLSTLSPNLTVVPVAGGRGQDFETAKLIEEVTGNLTDLKAVYSMGGGNLSILRVLGEAGLSPRLYIAHDLDTDNIRLLQDRMISFVMHHDLQTDLRHVFDAFLSHLGLSPPGEESRLSDIQIVSPENLPRAFVR